MISVTVVTYLFQDLVYTSGQPRYSRTTSKYAYSHSKWQTPLSLWHSLRLCDASACRKPLSAIPSDLLCKSAKFYFPTKTRHVKRNKIQRRRSWLAPGSQRQSVPKVSESRVPAAADGCRPEFVICGPRGTFCVSWLTVCCRRTRVALRRRRRNGGTHRVERDSSPATRAARPAQTDVGAFVARWQAVVFNVSARPESAFGQRLRGLRQKLNQPNYASCLSKTGLVTRQRHWPKRSTCI